MKGWASITITGTSHHLVYLVGILRGGAGVGLLSGHLGLQGGQPGLKT